jgi:hypothetical protein
MTGRDFSGAELDNLSRVLLRLHKALLDDARVSYERAHGRIESTGAYFQLVMGHEWFAWLRPLSQLILRIDELGEAEAPARAKITEVVAAVRTLLTASAESEGFARNYHDALQREPEVVLVHAAVRELLR